MLLNKKTCKDFVTVYDICWFTSPQLRWIFGSNR